MEKLDNIQVFAFCVAEVMDQLYAAFPIPTELSSSRVSEVYGPSREDSEPRLVQPQDADYADLFRWGLSERAGLADAAYETYPEPYNQPREGDPFLFWTYEQRISIRDHRVRAREAEGIYRATVAFLLREEYIKDVPPPEGPGPRGQTPFVLTSKGFAHLNKKFEGHTIRDEFHYGTAKKVFKVVKGAGEVTSAAKSVVDALATFFAAQ